MRNKVDGQDGKKPDSAKYGQILSTGGRNLMVLGIGAIAIALVATSISLLVYHNSGDIYIDRSRPGFLPDEEEISEGEESAGEEYDFAKNGKVTVEGLDEYLENLKVEMEAANAYEKPFGPEVLSDEHLGIIK